MKTKIRCIVLLILVVGTFLFLQKRNDKIEQLRAQHIEFFNSHKYNETSRLTEEERKKLGIPPNGYFEQEYLLEMNPATGKPEYEKKLSLQEELRKNSLLKNVPGSDNNAWVERGPNNVPGRTRAMLFDPNDPAEKRVFAGGVSGGLWVNNDITNSNSPWTNIEVAENLAVSSITVDPNDSMTMYLGTGESYSGASGLANGIFKSTDGGNSWENVLGINRGTTFFNGGSKVTVNSPASIAGDFTAVAAGFGPSIAGSITGNLVLVDDGTAAARLGCNTLTNGSAINGSIAVVERGACNFTIKVKNAQNEGAVAVIVINNAAGNPIIMGGTDATINIPSFMISKENGEEILTALQSQTVNATLADDSSSLPSGFTFVPGIFHVNDIVTRNNNGTTEIYAAIADAPYFFAASTLFGDGSEYGLYKSVDGGATWGLLTLPTTSNGNRIEPNDIEIGPDNKIWMSSTGSSSFGDGGGTILSSADGTNFTQEFVVPNGLRTEIEISETNPNKIYVLAETATVTILKTEDAFATTPTTLPLPVDTDFSVEPEDFTRGQAGYDLMLEADPTNDEVLYVGGINSFRSVDGGTSWSKMSQWFDNSSLTVPIVHADIHELSFDPSNPDKGIIATDGGVYYANSFAAASTSRTAIFSSNNGYNTTQFYWGAIGQNTSTDQLIAGAQDNGTNFVNGGGNGINASNEILGGDGAYCFIDKEGEYIIAATQFNNYFRFSLPNVNSSVQISDDEEGSFINPADLDDNLDILYSNGTNSTVVQISKFTNIKSGTPQREDLTNNLLVSRPTAIKVSPFTTGSTTLFIGTGGGDVLKVTNANGTGSWSRITGAEFVGSISAIGFGNNENELLVTFHNYGVENIWYTTDGGTTWQDKEGDFPDIPVKAIMMNPLLNDEVIIGTDLGVWRTSNFKSTSPNWVRSQNGMQDVKITSFDLRTADNTILATTFGRGFFTGKFTATPLSVEEIAAEDDRITLFPNPSDGYVKIRTTFDFGMSKITVFDSNGRVVHTQNSTLSETTELNVSNLKSGLYVLRIQSEQFGYNKKFFIK